MLPVNNSVNQERREEMMKRMMIRYKVKPDLVAENESYIRNVFEEIKREHPAGIRYASFKLDDGVSFMHLVSVETPDDSNPLWQLESFKAFTSTVAGRYEEAAVTVQLQEVGSYGWFGD